MTKSLEKILSMLDENLLKEKIDDPVDQALTRYRNQWLQADDQKTFHLILGAFIRDINCADGNSIPINEAEAIDEALWFVRNHYKHEESRGYDAALIDALDENSYGILEVLEYVAESYKSLRRKRYVAWVLATALDPSDWQQRVDLATEIFKRFKSYLSPKFHELKPYQMAHELEALLQLIISTRVPTETSRRIQPQYTHERSQMIANIMGPQSWAEAQKKKSGYFQSSSWV
jgi:hypothetical protein